MKTRLLLPLLWKPDTPSTIIIKSDTPPTIIIKIYRPCPPYLSKWDPPQLFLFLNPYIVVGPKWPQWPKWHKFFHYNILVKGPTLFFQYALRLVCVLTLCLAPGAQASSHSTPIFINLERNLIFINIDPSPHKEKKISGYNLISKFQFVAPQYFVFLIIFCVLPPGKLSSRIFCQYSIHCLPLKWPNFLIIQTPPHELFKKYAGTITKDRIFCAWPHIILYFFNSPLPSPWLWTPFFFSLWKSSNRFFCQ